MNHAEPFTPQVVALHPDPLIRAGVVATLRRQTLFEIFEGEPGEDLEAPGPVVRVVIADHLQATGLVKGLSKAGTRVLVLTASDREADIRRALEAGVDGYIVLGGPLGELIDGVMTLANGGRYLARVVAQRLADSVTHAILTSRELDVLKLVAAGLCNKAIGRRLEIGVGTVKSHMNAVMAKLNATSRTHAAAIAITRGLIEDRTPVAPAGYTRQLSIGNPLVAARAPCA